MKATAMISPNARGRAAGACYLGIFVAGFIYSALIPNVGFLSTIDAGTVQYLVSHQTTIWTGFPFFLLNVGCRLLVTLAFYELFKVVNRSIALLGVYFHLVCAALLAAMAICLLVPPRPARR